MEYLLFKREFSDDLKSDGKIACRDGVYDIESITLKFGKLYVEDEKRSFGTTLSRLRFALLSKNRARIFYVRDGSRVVHTSYVIPKCRKFPFLNKNDFEIGPCYTDKEYRGLGIYPQVLKHIIINGEGTTYYMIVSDTNKSSIRGVQKAGFEICGNVCKTKFKRYKLLSGNVR